MVWVYLLSYVFVIGMAMNYHEELEKTGIMQIQKVIEENANVDDVQPKEKEEKKEKKNKKKK
jgi:uncharacterized BrkB/YihY/UPF0761 family membrane protein